MAFAFVHLPPIMVASRVGAATEDTMGAMLEEVGRVLASSEVPHALVYDAGKDSSGRPDARARARSADWLAQNETLLRERCLGADFTFPNALSRGVLTAILWVRKPPIPIEVHGTVLRALESAIARTRAELDPDEVARAVSEARRQIAA